MVINGAIYTDYIEAFYAWKSEVYGGTSRENSICDFSSIRYSNDFIHWTGYTPTVSLYQPNDGHFGLSISCGGLDTYTAPHIPATLPINDAIYMTTGIVDPTMFPYNTTIYDINTATARDTDIIFKEPTVKYCLFAGRFNTTEKGFLYSAEHTRRSVMNFRVYGMKQSGVQYKNFTMDYTQATPSVKVFLQSYYGATSTTTGTYKAASNSYLYLTSAESGDTYELVPYLSNKDYNVDNNYFDTTDSGGITSEVSDVNASYIWSPVSYNFTFLTYNPTVYRDGDTLRIGSGASIEPQNGYTITVDGGTLSSDASNVFAIPQQYRNGHHTWTVTANRDTTVQNVKASLKYAEGFDTTEGGETLWMPIAYNITGSVGSVSSTTTLVDEKKLDKPTHNTTTKLAPNKYTVSWYSVPNASSYSVKINTGEWISVSTNLQYTCDNLPVGSNTISVRANYITSTYNSDPLWIQITTSKLEQPANVNITRDGINTVNMTWSSVPYATSYSIAVNGTNTTTTQNTYIPLTLVYGSNLVTITAVYTDTTYNSNTVSKSYSLSKLTTPNATGSRHYNNDGGTDAIVMSWATVPNAGSYRVRAIRSYTDPQTHQPATQTTYYYPDSTSLTIYGSTAFSSGAHVSLAGHYDFQVQAVAFSEASDFDSEYSATTSSLSFDIHTLLAPVASWKSASTGLQQDQSTLTWLPTIDEDDDENYPDYYQIDATGLKSDFILTNSYDVTNINGLTTPSNTANYTVTVWPYCYNTLEYQTASTSVSNSLTYSVVKLDTPTGLSYNAETSTLSWTAVNNANKYYIYENKENTTPVLHGTSATNSFTFNTPLAGGLHYLYVVATREVLIN